MIALCFSDRVYKRIDEREREGEREREKERERERARGKKRQQSFLLWGRKEAAIFRQPSLSQREKILYTYEYTRGYKAVVCSPNGCKG